MHSTDKRAWKMKLEEDTTTIVAMNRNVKTFLSKVRVVGETSTRRSKKKGKQ